MFKSLITLMLLAIAVAPVTAQETAQQDTDVWLKVGIYSPNTGLAFGGGFAYWLTEEYGISLDVEYSISSETWDDIGGGAWTEEYINFPAHLNFIGRSKMDDDMTLYFSAGVTGGYRSVFYGLDFEDVGVDTESSGFAFGGNAAVALRYSQFFVEGRMIYFMFDTLEEIESIAAGDYQFSTMAGFRF